MVTIDERREEYWRVFNEFLLFRIIFAVVCVLVAAFCIWSFHSLPEYCEYYTWKTVHDHKVTYHNSTSLWAVKANNIIFLIDSGVLLWFAVLNLLLLSLSRVNFSLVYEYDLWYYWVDWCAIGVVGLICFFLFSMFVAINFWLISSSCNGAYVFQYAIASTYAVLYSVVGLIGICIAAVLSVALLCVACVIVFFPLFITFLLLKQWFWKDKSSYDTVV